MKRYDWKFWNGVVLCAGVGAVSMEWAGFIFQTLGVLIGGAIGFLISIPKDP